MRAQEWARLILTSGLATNSQAIDQTLVGAPGRNRLVGLCGVCCPVLRGVNRFERFRRSFVTGKDDVGSNCKPESIVADERDFDEYPDNGKPDQNEREHISKIHGASPLRCDAMPTTLPVERTRQSGHASPRSYIRIRPNTLFGLTGALYRPVPVSVRQGCNLYW
jgi:hypothetical protein